MVVVLGATIVTRLLGQLGIAVTSRAGDEPLPLQALVQRAFALSLVLGAVGTVAMIAIDVSGGVSLRLALIGAPAVVANVLAQTISGVLLGQGRIRLWNVVQLLPSVLSLGVLALLVGGLHTGVKGAVGAWAGSNVLTAAFALAATRDLWLPLARPRLLDRVSETIARLALVMGAVQIVNLISYRAELFVLGNQRGVGAVGIYSIAMQSVESTWLVPAALATAVTPPAVAARDEGQAARLIATAAGRALLYALGSAAAIGAASPFVIPMLFGHDFRSAVRPLELLLPGVAAYAPVTVLVVYLSVRREQPRLSLLVSVVGMLVTVGAALDLVPSFGLSGAAAASSLGYVAGAAAAWLFFLRLARQPKMAP